MHSWSFWKEIFSLGVRPRSVVAQLGSFGAKIGHVAKEIHKNLLQKPSKASIGFFSSAARCKEIEKESCEYMETENQQLFGWARVTACCSRLIYARKSIKLHRILSIEFWKILRIGYFQRCSSNFEDIGFEYLNVWCDMFLPLQLYHRETFPLYRVFFHHGKTFLPLCFDLSIIRSTFLLPFAVTNFFLLIVLGPSVMLLVVRLYLGSLNLWYILFRRIVQYNERTTNVN